MKTRGVLGEVQLAALLDQILTPDQYATNVATRPGSKDRVEFAIRLPGQDAEHPVWLPLDAKFPTEDYQRLQAAQETADATAMEQAAKALGHTRTIESAQPLQGQCGCGLRVARGALNPRQSRTRQHVVGIDRQRMLHLGGHFIDASVLEIDFVDDRHDLMVVGDRLVDIGEGLGLDPLGGVDDEKRALAGGKRARDLIGEIDMARRVDQVEDVFLAVLGGVVEADGIGLDGDATLALEIHRVEHLCRHFTLR